MKDLSHWVGKRVAMYSGDDRYVGNVERATEHGMLFVTNGPGWMGWFHLKQCRILKKKETRYLWLERRLLYRTDDPRDPSNFFKVKVVGEDVK